MAAFVVIVNIECEHSKIEAVVPKVDVEYTHSQIEVAVLFGVPVCILALHAAFFVLSAQNFLYIFNGMPRLKER